jgi:hypothetical protein
MPMFTIRLCHDLTGWFATQGDDTLGYPGVRVHGEHAFASAHDAMRALDLTQALAQRLSCESRPLKRGHESRASEPRNLGSKRALEPVLGHP